MVFSCYNVHPLINLFLKLIQHHKFINEYCFDAKIIFLSMTLYLKFTKNTRTYTKSYQVAYFTEQKFIKIKSSDQAIN